MGWTTPVDGVFLVKSQRSRILSSLTFTLVVTAKSEELWNHIRYFKRQHLDVFFITLLYIPVSTTESQFPNQTVPETRKCSQAVCAWEEEWDSCTSSLSVLFQKASRTNALILLMLKTITGFSWSRTNPGLRPPEHNISFNDPDYFPILGGGGGCK